MLERDKVIFSFTMVIKFSFYQFCNLKTSSNLIIRPIIMDLIKHHQQFQINKGIIFQYKLIKFIKLDYR